MKNISSNIAKKQLYIAQQSVQPCIMQKSALIEHRAEERAAVRHIENRAHEIRSPMGEDHVLRQPLRIQESTHAGGRKRAK